MKNREIFLKIIKYASKAPSSHNTQPWKFRIDEGSITIIADLSLTLPVVDSDNHALFISLGCALENLLLAAAEFGFRTKTNMKVTGNDLEIQVEMEETETRVQSQLFPCMEKRQVNRMAYSTRKLDETIVKQLFHSIQDKGVQLKLFISDEEIAGLKNFILEGNQIQFSNRMFVNELVEWLRFSEKEAMQTGDGIWSATMGLPATGRSAGSFIMKRLVNARSESKRLSKLINQSAGFALFMTEKNDHEHWIRLGRVFQRFGLQSTCLGISHSHLNMPCEEQAVREKMAAFYKLNGLTPLLLIRFGYGKNMPYSFRRNLTTLIER